MQYGKFNVVVDGQWGSCGKGLIAGYLAREHEVNIASTNNLPNAGHTLVMEDGKKFISKILPVSTFLNKFGQNVQAIIGPGAGFFLDRLRSESEECGTKNIRIHPRSMVVQDRHAELERSVTKHIASTMQGSGAVQVDRLMRGSNVKLARDFQELEDYVTSDWIDETHKKLSKSMWLHEGSQGFSLGILHGSHYPHCTSRECTTTREMQDMGFAPQQIGDVYMVIRPYPIRVGNVIENGEQVGYSGDVYPGQVELQWSDIKAWSGYPESYDLQEMTTVTKRLRRVFTFSMDQVRRACMVNGATKLVLNFANYLDYKIYATSGKLARKLPIEVRKFIDRLEDEIGITVALVGTGPNINHIWELQ
jgi:adenylosuccinate synthase